MDMEVLALLLIIMAFVITEVDFTILLKKLSRVGLCHAVIFLEAKGISK